MRRSVGCTIIELITGSPPYFEFAPVSAMFRIVSDEHPPLPDGISPVGECAPMPQLNELDDALTRGLALCG